MGLRMRRFFWDSRDCALVSERRSEDAVGPISYSVALFALRCAACGRFTTGCKDHWFCGVCESCRSEMEQSAKEDDEPCGC